MPMIGTKGTRGVRKPRSSSGLRHLRIHTATQTTMDELSPPILTNSATLSMLNSPATTAVNMPTMIVGR